MVLAGVVRERAVGQVDGLAPPISSTAPPGPRVVLPEIVQSVGLDGAVPAQLENPPPLSAAVLFEIVQPVSSAQPSLVEIPPPLRPLVLPECAVGQLDRAVSVQPSSAAELL